ncbi:MAG: epsilon-lactone hydrolase [Solirubrobacteraceae bacterium]
MDDSENVVAFPQAPEAIELRHLRAFVAVAEELNFGRAAERMYITQPALSRQIRALEQLLGCTVLRRSTHRVELTLAGEALLDRVRPVLREVDATVSTVQSVGGELVGRVARLWEPLIQAAAADADLQEHRMAYEKMLANFSPPAEVIVTPVNAGGVPSLLVAQEPDEAPRLLHLHGGGYVVGSAFGYRPLAGALALAANAGVLVPDYRLAPEHPFPAAIEDALCAYQWTLDRGVAPDEVTLCGDSSGGGLVVSVLLTIEQRGLPRPGGAVLMCPWVDLAATLDHSVPDALRRSAAAYLGAHPADDPVVSPLTADLSGLPPLLIQAATGDDRLADANALVDRARSHDVDARLDLYSVDAHVFQLFWSFLPEAAEALKAAGAFAREVTASEPLPAATARRARAASAPGARPPRAPRG